MAKPDLQRVYVNTSNGDLKRLKGRLGLAEAAEHLVLVSGSDDVDAAASGVPVRGLYVGADSALRVRLS